jgi:hypothetical protein
MDNTFINGVLTLSYISSGTTSYPIPWADPTTSYFYRVGVINAGGNSEFSAYKTVKTYAIGISNPNQEKSIYSFYPNPVINNLNFEYVLLNNSSVQLAIYNLNGQMVKTLLNYGQQTVGSYSESFDVSGLERGIYLARFTTGACAETFKIVIAK